MVECLSRMHRRWVQVRRKERRKAERKAEEGKERERLKFKHIKKTEKKNCS